jgi:hypothetical protein
VEELMTAKTGFRPAQNAHDRREPQPPDERRREQLDRRYGRIGIAAVAAALPYAGHGKNLAYAPVISEIDYRLAEVVI